MTLEEILKLAGLTEAQITEVLQNMKSNKIFTSREENLDLRYNKLKSKYDELVLQNGKNQTTIAELQKATSEEGDIRSKITEYEQTIEEQKKEIEKAKLENALKLGLLSAGAKVSDIDYLIYKMDHDADWKAELDVNGKVKGFDEKLTSMKTEYPNQFNGSASKLYEEKRLEQPAPKETKVTKEEFAKMGYRSKVQLKKENPELYKELTND